MKIEVGQIFQVCTSFAGNMGDKKDDKKRIIKQQLMLKKDEFVEIRYPFEWHFRTIDNVYLQASAKDILKNCKYIGKIEETTRRKNKVELLEILVKKLYVPLFDEEFEE